LGVTDEPTEILTAAGEDSEVELLQWRLERTVEEATRQTEHAKQAWSRVAELQRAKSELLDRLERLTSRMTVAELRRVGVTVTLDYYTDEED
jgi:hypothetical protein